MAAQRPLDPVVRRRDRPRPRRAQRAGDGARRTGVQQGRSDPRGQGRRLGVAYHTEDLGPVAGHARRLRGVDLLVQAAEAREAGGEEGGAGVDIATSGRRLWGGELLLPILPVAKPWGGGPLAESEWWRGCNLTP